MLTHLPEVLSIDILSNWCDLKTVAKLDSAFCNKLDRMDFQHLLHDPTFASTDSKYCHSELFWRWIVNKRIKLIRLNGMWWGNISDDCVAELDCSKVIEFHTDKLQEHPAAKLINKSHHLKTIDITCTVNAFNELMPLLS
jgi:hypothetical protein